MKSKMMHLTVWFNEVHHTKPAFYCLSETQTWKHTAEATHKWFWFKCMNSLTLHNLIISHNTENAEDSLIKRYTVMLFMCFLYCQSRQRFCMTLCKMLLIKTHLLSVQWMDGKTLGDIWRPLEVHFVFPLNRWKSPPPGIQSGQPQWSEEPQLARSHPSVPQAEDVPAR